MNELKYKVKTVYGKELYYPDNTAAKAICAVAGQKTLSRRDLERLGCAGFRVTVTSPNFLPAWAK